MKDILDKLMESTNEWKIEINKKESLGIIQSVLDRVADFAEEYEFEEEYINTNAKAVGFYKYKNEFNIGTILITSEKELIQKDEIKDLIDETLNEEGIKYDDILFKTIG